MIETMNNCIRLFSALHNYLLHLTALLQISKTKTLKVSNECCVKHPPTPNTLKYRQSLRQTNNNKFTTKINTWKQVDEFVLHNIQTIMGKGHQNIAHF